MKVIVLVVAVVAALIALKVVWWLVKKAIWATVLSIAILAAAVLFALVHFGVLRL